MTDKEFKRLSRSQLIDIIYQLQLRQDELLEENKRLSRELEDKRLRISKAGNIAEAALEINNVLQAAQNAAELYLEEIKHMQAEGESEIPEATEKEPAGEAEDILRKREEYADYDAAIAEILKDYRND